MQFRRFGNFRGRRTPSPRCPRAYITSRHGARGFFARVRGIAYVAVTQSAGSPLVVRWITSLSIRSLTCRWITSLPTPLSLSLSLSDYWIVSLPLPPSSYALLTEEDAHSNEVGHWCEVGRATFIGAAPTLLSGSWERTPDVVRR